MGPTSRLAIYDNTYKLKIAATKLLTSDLVSKICLVRHLNAEELGLGYSGC